MSDLTWKIRAGVTRLNRSSAAMWNNVQAQRAKPRNIPEKFDHYPEPRSIGTFETGQKLMEGQFEFAGNLVETSAQSIWSISTPNAAFSAELQGFSWLDDLAAVGNKEARQLAQDWVRGWIRYYGDGSGTGWTPALTGRRILRICAHAKFLFRGLEEHHRVEILTSVTRQLNYLGKSWRRAAPGRPRLDALAGLVFAGVSFEGREKSLNLADKAVGDECVRAIDQNGDIASRNPEELMEIFTLLTWIFRTLKDAKFTPDPRLVAALERAAPTLRSLRLGDGSLTRFHGGGRGRAGRLDQVLSDSGIRGSRAGDLAMGYDRMTAGRSTLLIDCARPPQSISSQHGHASTLAFEMSSGRLPLVTNCGAGQKFGPEWERVCRATGAHNTVVVGTISSSSLAAQNFVSRTFGERLIATPQHVTRTRSSGLQGNSLVASHDGYTNFGLIHERQLTVSIDGREILGVDTFSRGGKPVNTAKIFAAHFHLHPDVKAATSKDGTKIVMQLSNKETWEFTQNGAKFSLEDSVYLDQWNLKPRTTKQIVASGAIVEYAGQITWMFKRVQDAERPKIAPRQTP